MSDVLLVTSVTPAAGGNGLAMRAGVFLEALAARHAVRVLVVPVHGGAAPPDAFVHRLATAFDVVELRGTVDAADMVRRLASPAGRERAQAVHPRPPLSARVTMRVADTVAAAARGCTAVVVLRTYLAPALDTLLDAPVRPALLLDLDDVEHDRLEAYYVPHVDAALVCSPDDAGPGLLVVPNAIRPPIHVAPAPRAVDLLMVGNLSHAPNVEGARWLCEAVVSHLPGVRVVLAGSRPAPEVRRLAGERVEVVADPPAVGPWYRAARVAVVPILRGGGTRIKLLEAQAHGVPVVATPAGARGLPTEDVLLARDPEAFADACRRLLADPDGAGRLAARAAERVQARFGVEVVAGRIDLLVREAVSARGSARG